MLKLKTILQYSIILIVLLSVYIRTKVIKYSSIYNLDTTNIVGTIKDYDIKSNYIKIEIQAKELIECYLYDNIDKYKDSLNIGYKVSLEGNINEVINNTIPNTFNYKEYLYNKKIYYTFTIDSITIISKDISFIDRIKNFIYKRCLNIDNTGYLTMFILGKKNIDKDTYNNLKTMNITHIFSISGFYLSLISLSISKILNKKKHSNIFKIIIYIMYLLLTCFNISLIKSFLLFIGIDLKKKYNLKIENKDILIYNGLLLLIINPFYLYDIGYLYSYLCTYGILSINYHSKSYIKRSIYTSLICLIYSLPLSISINYSYNILSILFNIIYIPFITYIFYPLCILSFLFKISYPILSILITILNSSVSMLSNINLIIVLPKMSTYMIIIYYILVFMFTYNRKYIYIIMICLLIIINKLSYYLDSKAYLYFLDVGQADSSLIISPYRKDITLIDIGGSISGINEAISKNMVTFLYSINIKEIDNLIISHGDCDHLCNGIYLMDYINIRNVTLNKGSINDYEKKYLSKVGNYNYKNMSLINLYNEVTDDENENSIFTYFKLYNTSFLYSGDATKEKEEEIISKYKLNVDILKVGHHGSKTSSSKTYLEKLKPKIALISSGRHNMYNHPSTITLNTLDTLGIKYYNTQDSGTIKFIINRNGYSIENFSP